MRISHRRLALALLPLLLLGPVVAACGGDDDPPAPPSAASEPEPAAAEADAPAPDEDTAQSGIAADVGSVRNGIEIISLTGDGQGDPAGEGDSVGVRYRGTLDDGSEFDSNADGALLPVTIGAGRVIAGFDEALRGLRIGQTIVVRIPPELAYGERDESLVIEIPRARTPPTLMVGQRVQYGGAPPGVITEITDEVVIVDANHELAGRALTFEISIETLE